MKTDILKIAREKKIKMAAIRKEMLALVKQVGKKQFILMAQGDMIQNDAFEKHRDLFGKLYDLQRS